MSIIEEGDILKDMRTGALRSVLYKRDCGVELHFSGGGWTTFDNVGPGRAFELWSRPQAREQSAISADSDPGDEDVCSTSAAPQQPALPAQAWKVYCKCGESYMCTPREEDYADIAAFRRRILADCPRCGAGDTVRIKCGCGEEYISTPCGEENVAWDETRRCLTSACPRCGSTSAGAEPQPQPQDPQVLELTRRLYWVLRHYVESDDGKFAFPDGEIWDCKKRASIDVIAMLEKLKREPLTPDLRDQLRSIDDQRRRNATIEWIIDRLLEEANREGPTQPQSPA